MSTLVIVGMASEKAIVGERPGIQTIVGAGNAPALAKQLEAAIAAGADHVISVGVTGALDPDLKVGEIVVGVSVCGEGETVNLAISGQTVTLAISGYNNISGAMSAADSAAVVNFVKLCDLPAIS